MHCAAAALGRQRDSESCMRAPAGGEPPPELSSSGWTARAASEPQRVGSHLQISDLRKDAMDGGSFSPYSPRSGVRAAGWG